MNDLYYVYVVRCLWWQEETLGAITIRCNSPGSQEAEIWICARLRGDIVRDISGRSGEEGGRSPEIYTAKNIYFFS